MAEEGGGWGLHRERVESREQRAESREQSVEGRETSSAWSFRNSGFCMPEDDRNVRHCIGEGGHASSGSTVERQCLRPTEDRVLLQALWFHHVEHPCPNKTVSLPFLVFSLPFELPDMGGGSITSKGISLWRNGSGSAWKGSVNGETVKGRGGGAAVSIVVPLSSELRQPLAQGRATHERP